MVNAMRRVELKEKRTLLILLIFWLAVLSVVFGLTLTQRVSASLRRLPVYSVDTGEEKKIAVTFDVAWTDDTTDAILQILSEHSVRASFFFVGEFAEKYPESVRKICNAGHDIGNHSMHHNDASKLGYTELCADIEACNDLLFSLTGKTPTLYRAPSGAYDNEVIEAAESLGMNVIQWDADSIDWKNITPAKMTERVLGKLSPGGILLFHLGKQNTAEALSGILDDILARGYAIVPVSELLISGESYIDANGKQHPLP